MTLTRTSREDDRRAVIEENLIRLAPQIVKTLPNNMSIDRFQAVTFQAIARNPDLVDCEPASIILAVLEAASLGLEPTGSLSQAWLVPYKPAGARHPRAQLMIGVRGLEELARRSGRVSSITSRVVYQGDEFEVWFGTDEKIVHRPSFVTDPTKITATYAIAHLTDGGQVFDVMTKDQIDAIRARSKAKNSGPWSTDYPEMARKTVVRRLAKTLPLSIEARDAIERDDELEFGQPTIAEGTAADANESLKEFLATRRTEIEAVEDGEGEGTDQAALDEEGVPWPG